MPTKAELGQRLRIARFQREMTLKEVAARCGMSATHISEVERGKTSPTIGALQRIAAALGEKTSYFVQEDELPRVRLTRSADRCDYFLVDAAGEPQTAEAISPGIPGGYAQVFRYRLEQGASMSGDSRIAEVVVHCVAGMVRVGNKEESHVLREGDTLQMRLDDGYMLENVGEEESELIAVLAAPTLVPV